MNIRSIGLALTCMMATAALPIYAQQQPAPHRNVILFVADGLRRGSVNEADTPALFRLRKSGVDFRDSYSVFPTFTTANASAIATGHALGDTGDFSNTLYVGRWLTHEDVAGAAGNTVPFLENDEILANMNDAFNGNYLGEKTLLGVAHAAGINVASVGKVGPTAIQANDLVGWSQLGFLDAHGAVVLDDSTGSSAGIALPPDILEDIRKAGLSVDAPLRSNGYGDTSQSNNAYSGDAANAGTLDANRIQEQWFAEVTTKVLLPKYAADNKPFLLVFWSRDPDGTQHNQGDSLQQISPGINGDSTRLALRNADHCLQQLLDWLDHHPAVKATTDVIVTSDHGFATLSRREIASDGTLTSEPSSALDYELSGKERPEPKGTLPTGFLGVDLAIRLHLNLFDPALRATAGPSVYAQLSVGGEKSQHPSTGSAFLGDAVKNIDGSDAKMIVAANGGSDLLYFPAGDAELVRSTVEILTHLDYVGGIFVDDRFCTPACPGALPLSAIRLVGSSKVPRPTVVVTFKVFYNKPGDLQTAVQVSDTTLQEGQGMHGGFGRDQTLNNMAAAGPDFKTSFADVAPAGNIDIAPTIAKILGLNLPSTGTLRGRLLSEALTGGAEKNSKGVQIQTSSPTATGARTILEYEELDGVRYGRRACLTSTDSQNCFQ